MKKTYLKILLSAVILYLIFVLTSCTNILEKIPGFFNKNKGEDDTELAGIVLIKNGISEFQIVHTADAGSAVVSRAIKLVEELRALGIEINDPISDGDPSKVTECELIIGTNAKNRGDELSISEKELGKDGFCGKIVGKKIILAGGTKDLTLSLFENFIRTEMKITKDTKELSSLAIREDFFINKETKYPIEKITIGNIDLSEFTLIYDIDTLSTDDQNSLKSFRDKIYAASGYWLEVSDASSTADNAHNFIFRLSENSGENGFRIYYDGKDFIAECAYDNVFSKGFEKFADKEIFNSNKTAIAFAENYLYEEFDAMYENITQYADKRAAISLKKSLDIVRSGRGTAAYGASATAVLGMPDSMITERDIELANNAIVSIANYLHDDNYLNNDTANGKGENDFVAIRIVRLLFTDQSRLNPNTKEALRSFFLNDDFESIHKSENHMLMFRTSRYLAACHYKGESFTQYGMTAEEIKKIDHDYLVSYMQFRARRGWAEFNSMGYEAHNFNSLLALHECAEDEDIKKLSEMLMETMLITMLENTTEGGIYGGAHGRGYSSIVSGLHTGIYWIGVLYFGANGISDTKTELPSFSEPYILLSDWRPDKSIYSIYSDKTYPFTSYERTHNHTLDYTPQEFGFINKYTYNTSLYSIGCVNRQDSFPKGNYYSGYEEHQQTNWSLAFANAPNAGITVHHPGNTGTHPYWCGDTGCCCNHLFGEKNTVIGIYYIPYKYDGLMNFIHANVPKAQYDEVIEDAENNRLFVRLGDAYAALTFSHEYKWGGENPESEIVIYDGEKTSDIRIAFACQAGDRENDGTFSEFIASVKEKEFKFYSSDLILVYGNMRYELIPDTQDLKRTQAENHYLDGKLVDMNYEYTYNSPFMKSKFDSGVIEIYYDNKVRVLDFINITDTVRE